MTACRCVLVTLLQTARGGQCTFSQFAENTLEDGVWRRTPGDGAAARWDFAKFEYLSNRVNLTSSVQRGKISEYLLSRAGGDNRRRAQENHFSIPLRAGRIRGCPIRSCRRLLRSLARGEDSQWPGWRGRRVRARLARKNREEIKRFCVMMAVIPAPSPPPSPACGRGGCTIAQIINAISPSLARARGIARNRRRSIGLRPLSRPRARGWLAASRISISGTLSRPRARGW